ncbi:TonB-dependent receptor [Chitinophaga defluvii]|uniref:TonB-dependent receptor n=1 Tax=Chitinophaga defluvii TaxID=3163343 RepID=A0ABV2TEB9_9BACT
MKLTAFLLLIACLHISAKGVSQQVTISVKKVSLKKFFKEVTRQTGMSVVYDEALLAVTTPVTIDVKDVPVKEVLDKCLKDQPISYIIEGNSLIIKGLPVKAPVTVTDTLIRVSGRITDEKGEPVPGGNVRIKGASIGTAADANGNYSLQLRGPKDTLVYTYIGSVEQEIPAAGRAVINVKLVSQTSPLSEVVVVGYGTQKKADVTGSIATVKGEVLTKAPTPNLANALTGKITGVITTQQSGKPGFDDPTFLIRGKSTFGDNTALVLVDGVERSMSRIDPNEIESVTVLKDAASAAVYGARGANGVVLITTKRGKAGKTKFSYTGNVGFQQPTIVPKLMNAYDYATYLNIAKVNQGEAPRFTPDQVEKFRTGELPSTNWWKSTLKDRAAIQQHNLTLSGGNATGTKYFVSLGYLDQDGLYDLSSFKRYNLRANIDNQVTPSLAISLDIGGRFENLSQSAVGDGLFSTIINSKPTERAYVPDAVKAGGLGSNGQNASPVGQANNSGYNKTNNNVFQGTLQAVYTAPFVKGLSAKLRYSYDRFFSDAKTFTTNYTYYNYDRVNDLYTPFKSGGGTNLYDGSSNDGLRTLQTFLNYDREFGMHNVSGLLLFEQSAYNSQNLQASRVQYISTAIDQLFAGPTLNQTNGGSATETARRGYVGRVNYEYAHKYMFQANFRYDGSFNFPNGKRWGFFPAVSAGWRIDQETFMKDVSFISNLKLRASYGQFGNDRVPAFQYLSGFRFGPGSVIGGNYQSGIGDIGIPNPDITWETATNTDIGLEFGILDGKVSGEVNYFYKRTKNILLPRNASVPETFGATLPYENIGVVDNKGMEAVLRYRNRFGEVTLLAEGNITYSRSKVIFMDEPTDVESRIKRTGQPFDQFFALEGIGIFQTQDEINKAPDQDGNGNQSIKPGDLKYLDYNNDGKIDGKDIHRVGKGDIPNVIFGFNLSMNYKGFDLTAAFQGATGFQQYLRFDPFNLEANALAMFKDSWTPDNPGAKYPALYAGTRQNNRLSSSFWLYDATYLKLRNLELAYTIGKNELFRKAGIQHVRVFVSGNNLLRFSKMKDFDPETPNINPDSKAYYYPQMKTYNLGVNVEF